MSTGSVGFAVSGLDIFHRIVFMPGMCYIDTTTTTPTTNDAPSSVVSSRPARKLDAPTRSVGGSSGRTMLAFRGSSKHRCVTSTASEGTAPRGCTIEKYFSNYTNIFSRLRATHNWFLG